jgi:hypothetical protein
MKNMIKFASAAAVALALTQSLQANPIVGNIGFGGAVTYDTASAGNATEVTSWINPTVQSVTHNVGSSFNLVNVGMSVVFNPTTWIFNSGAGINPFWSVGGFTFQLLSSSVQSQGGVYPVGYVTVTGIGIISGNGYDPTYMSWSFTSQDPVAGNNPDQWTFSASQASLNVVPDGGATVMLLGLALSGVALLKKKLSA